MHDKRWLVLDVFGTTPRVIGSGGRPKSNTSLERDLRERLPHRLALSVRDAIRAAVDEAPTTMSRISFGQATQLAFQGVFGPDGSLYGLSVWVGDTDESPGPPPGATGFDWDSDRRLIHLPAVMPPELAPAGFATDRRTITSPEFFRVFEVEDSIGLIRTLLSHDPGAEYDCTAHFQRAGESISAVHLVLAAATDRPGRWRGISHDMLPESAMTPSLEAATLKALPKLTPHDMHMALVDVAKMRILRWVSDPITQVQWKGVRDNRDTPHPDDVEQIFAAVIPVMTGEARSAEISGVRLRRLDGDKDGYPWVVVDGDGTLLTDSNDDGPKLGLMRLRVVGYSDDPDPVPIDDPGHPGI